MTVSRSQNLSQLPAPLMTPVSVQKGFIGLTINGLLVQVLLWGNIRSMWPGFLITNWHCPRYIHSRLCWHCIHLLWAGRIKLAIRIRSNLCSLVSKKSSRRWVIIGAISLSYAGYSIVAIVPWYLTQDQLINDSKTRQSIYEAFRFSAAWVTLVNDIIVFIMSALADGILVSENLVPS